MRRLPKGNLALDKQAVLAPFWWTPPRGLGPVLGPNLERDTQKPEQIQKGVRDEGWTAARWVCLAFGNKI